MGHDIHGHGCGLSQHPELAIEGIARVGVVLIDSRLLTPAQDEDGPAQHDEGPSDAVLWDLRTILRTRLVGEVRRRVREAWLQRGASVPELSWTEHIFDPDVLTVGFARRVPTYKRLTLMLRDPERLTRLLTDPERPVQIVIGRASCRERV